MRSRRPQRTSQAPAISVVKVTVVGEYHGQTFDQEIPLRLIYEGRSGVLPRGAPEGAWRLVFLPLLPDDPMDE